MTPIPATPRRVGLVHRIVTATTRTDRAGVRWIGPLRIAVVTGGAAAVGLWLGTPIEAILVGVGALFTGASDQPGAFGARLQGMLLAVVGVGVGTGLGLLVCGNQAVQLLVAIPVALVAGYAGAGGPRTGVAGLGVLVTYAVFSGTPVPLATVASGVALMALGGAAQVLAMAATFVTRRSGGLRQDIAVALRGVSRAVSGRDGGATSMGAVAKLSVARGTLDQSAAAGATREWANGMLDALDDARFAAITIEGSAAGRDAGQEQLVDTVRAAASRLLTACAHVLVLPARRGRVTSALAALRDAEAACRDGLDPADRASVADLAGRLGDLAALVAAPWPVGRRAERRDLRRRPAAPQGRRLRWPQDPGHTFRAHAIRLAAVYVAAMAVSFVDGFDHASWLPLTVGWIARPDQAGTAERIASRVLGTFAGIAVIAAVTEVVGAADWVLLMLILAGAFLVAAFVLPNYAVSSIGATLAILGLLSLSGSPIDGLLAPRLVETVLAGVLVYAGACIRPTRLADDVAGHLARLARALTAYARAVSAGDAAAGRTARGGFVQARGMASAALRATALEPGAHRIPNEHAYWIEDRLVQAAAIVAAQEAQLQRDVAATGSDPGLDQGALGRLDLLVERLDALQAGDSLPPAPGTPGDRSPFARLVEEAHDAVGECAAAPAR